MDVDSLVATLHEDGIVVIPSFVTGEPLRRMQFAFARALESLRANNAEGYEKTEHLRDMIEIPLLLDRGFLDLGLHPTIIEAVRRHVGPEFQLVECKGWRSRKTRRNWVGWHGDEWYDQDAVPDRIPKEIKLALYLTDVASGGLSYVKQSHRRLRPMVYPRKVGMQTWEGRHTDVLGQAGTAILFDTSGIHRQAYPILDIRHAVFYCYHDPAIPLRAEDVRYNRYRPLHLNAAFLGGLTAEQQRILGFGDQHQFIHGHRRAIDHQLLHTLYSRLLETSLLVESLAEPVTRRMKALRRKFLNRPGAG